MDRGVGTKIFDSNYTLSYSESDLGNTYEIKFSDDAMLIYIPKDKIPHHVEYLLTYRVQKKLIDLHDSILKSKSLLLLRNLHKSEDLVEFNFNNKTYHYTSLKEMNSIDENTTDKIRDLVINLNLSLNKLGYSLK